MLSIVFAEFDHSLCRVQGFSLGRVLKDELILPLSDLAGGNCLFFFRTDVNVLGS